jgi:putative acetyltransferase
VSIEVNVESLHSADALALIRDLSAELGARYGDDGAGAFKPADVDVAGAAFVVARLDGRPVGCGVGEVKRMFIEPSMRGRGISRLILRKIEAVAAEFGYRTLRLETGLRQPEAIGLYETAGYWRAPCYGIYVDNPLSVCFEKQLLNHS